MGKYVDGYVLPILKDKVEEYRKIASEAGKIWKKHGALQYFECIGDDLTPDMGMGDMKIVQFPTITNAGPDETVVFAFVVFKSKEHRDEVNKKVMTDPYMTDPSMKDKTMPFDATKMVYGGFNVIVEE